jgi:hypothetical protein
MSDRPTQTPASRAPQPQASGESLAARAARFRNGAPFLVERATLYDPDPLDLPVAPADRRRHSPRSLLPAALTLLGVVVVVGLAAGILFVRNADGPRTDVSADRGREQGAGRLGQFSERGVPRPSTHAPSADAPVGRDKVAYDLTRRSNETIIGAWRPHGEIERPPVAETKPAAPTIEPEAAPEIVSPATETPSSGLRRLMPRRLTGWLAKQKADQISGRTAEPAVPPRAPLDDPYVSNASAEDDASKQRRAPLDEPHVPKTTASTGRVAPRSTVQDTASAPHGGPARVRPRVTPGATENPGANVVARVGRETDPKERNKASGGGSGIEPLDAEKPSPARERYATSSARRAELRRLRDARRQALDLDRFLLRDKGEIPRGFVFSGPQAQRP